MAAVPLPAATRRLTSQLSSTGFAEIARRLSADEGHYFSVYWSPSAYQILEAIDGKVTALFDPIYVEADDDEPRSGEIYPGWLTGSEFLDDQHIRSTCMTLMEQRTGIPFDRRCLTRMVATYSIPDPDELLKNLPGARFL
ncbi:MAG: hypothetical protein M3443_17775 [Actinomycetota bacterium]|nr:hypothetical protein [Actinomycetota bacterium]